MTKAAVKNTLKAISTKAAANNLEQTVLAGYWKKDRFEILSEVEDKKASIIANSERHS